MASSSTSECTNSDAPYNTISLSLFAEPTKPQKTKKRKTALGAKPNHGIHKSQQPRFRFTVRQDPPPQTQAPAAVDKRIIARDQSVQCDTVSTQNKTRTSPVEWVTITTPHVSGSRSASFEPHNNCGYTYSDLIRSICSDHTTSSYANAVDFRHMTALFSHIFNPNDDHVDTMAWWQTWSSIILNKVMLQRFAKVSYLYQYLFFIPSDRPKKWEAATTQLSRMLNREENLPITNKCAILPNFLLISAPCTSMRCGFSMPLLMNFGCDIPTTGAVKPDNFPSCSPYYRAWQSGVCLNIFVAFVIFRPDILLNMLKNHHNSFWSNFPVEYKTNAFFTLGGERSLAHVAYWCQVFDAIKQIRRLTLSYKDSPDHPLVDSHGNLKRQYYVDEESKSADSSYIEQQEIYGTVSNKLAFLTSQLFMWICKRLGPKIPNNIGTRPCLNISMTCERANPTLAYQTFESFAFNNFADCIAEVSKFRPFNYQNVINVCTDSLITGKPNLQKSFVTIAALHLKIDFNSNHPAPVFEHFKHLMKKTNQEHRIASKEEKEEEDVQFTNERSWKERDDELRKRAIPIDDD